MPSTATRGIKYIVPVAVNTKNKSIVLTCNSLQPVALATRRWATGAWSLWPVPTRRPPMYEIGALLLSYRGMSCRARTRTLTTVAQNDVACLVSRPGIECGRRDSNSETARFERARYAGFPSRPHSTPPRTRTETPWIKSPLLWPLS